MTRRNGGIMAVASARANNEAHDASAEQTLVVAGIALPVGACPGSSQSSYSRTGP